MKNKLITISPSKELEDMQLTELVGQRGYITENLTYTGRKNKGYMVHLEKPFLNSVIWFIPKKSVAHG